MPFCHYFAIIDHQKLHSIDEILPAVFMSARLSWGGEFIMEFLSVISSLLLAAIVIWLVWPLLDPVLIRGDAEGEMPPEPEILNAFVAMANRTKPKDCLVQNAQLKDRNSLKRAARKQGSNMRCAASANWAHSRYSPQSGAEGQTIDCLVDEAAECATRAPQRRQLSLLSTNIDSLGFEGKRSNDVLRTTKAPRINSVGETLYGLGRFGL